MGLLRLLLLPDIAGMVRRTAATLGRIAALHASLRPPPGPDGRSSRADPRRLATRRGVAALALAALSSIAGALLALTASAQDIDAGIFAEVDEAARDLFAFLSGADAEAGGSEAAVALGSMIWVFNAAMLVLAGALLVWHVLAGTVDTARQGRWGLGGWEIVRIVAAAALIAPLPGGLSGGQHAVLLLAGLGGDMAQAVWRPFAGRVLGDAEPVRPRPAENAVRGLMARTLLLETCMATDARFDHGFWNWSGPIVAVEVEDGDALVRRYEADVPTTLLGRGDALCGAIRFPGVGAEGPGGDVARAHLAGLRASLPGLGRAAARIAAHYDLDAAEYNKTLDPAVASAAVEAATAAYLAVLEPVLETASAAHHEDVVRRLTAESAKDQSWIQAGSLFALMAYRIGAFEAQVHDMPSAAAPPVELAEKRERVHAAVAALSKILAATPGAGFTPFPTAAPPVDAPGGGDWGSRLLARLAIPWDSVIQADSGNPMLDLAGMGGRLIHTALVAFSSLTGASVTAAVFADSQVLGSKLPNVFRAAWEVADAPVTLALQAMMIAGLVLHYLLPALPFVRWLFALLGWLLQIVEAAFAIVVWLVALASRGDGERLVPGRLTGGLLLLAGVALRPALMVLGLILSFFVFDAIITLLNDVWLDHLKTSRPGDTGFSPLGSVAHLVIYTLTAWGLLNATLKLIDGLPDAAMNWIGAPGRGELGDNIAGGGVGAAGRFGGLARVSRFTWRRPGAAPQGG